MLLLNYFHCFRITDWAFGPPDLPSLPHVNALMCLAITRLTVWGWKERRRKGSCRACLSPVAAIIEQIPQKIASNALHWSCVQKKVGKKCTRGWAGPWFVPWAIHTFITVGISFVLKTRATTFSGIIWFMLFFYLDVLQKKLFLSHVRSKPGFRCLRAQLCVYLCTQFVW